MYHCPNLQLYFTESHIDSNTKINQTHNNNNNIRKKLYNHTNKNEQKHNSIK